VRVGIAHHLGWAVAVTASAGHVVVDRRRIELIEPGLPTAPVEHEARHLDDDDAVLGPPWTRDHRMALAATIVAS
jgi:hypothetical protein